MQFKVGDKVQFVNGYRYTVGLSSYEWDKDVIDTVIDVDKNHDIVVINGGFCIPSKELQLVKDKHNILADILQTDESVSAEKLMQALESQANSTNDVVNHPSHYTDGKIETIEYIEDKKLGFHLGNACKYISRAGKKDPSKRVEDLEKAVWYINRQIKLWKAEDKG